MKSYLMKQKIEWRKHLVSQANNQGPGLRGWAKSTRALAALRIWDQAYPESVPLSFSAVGAR